MEEEEDDGDEVPFAIFGQEIIDNPEQTFARFLPPDPGRGAVMVEWPRSGASLRPQAQVRDSWDDRHVRMPFSKVTTFKQHICVQKLEAKFSSA